MKARIVGFYNYTVVLTYIGSLAGLLGVCSAVRGDARAAAICLMASGLCDLFDGTVAQTRARTAQEKRFGVQIDSLSDLVSFGVQPAAIGYCIGVRGAQVIVLCCYALAALIRLAYYNVTEDELLEEGSGRDAYEGLPVTTATIMFPLLVAVRGFLGEAAPHVYAGAMLLMAAADPYSEAPCPREGGRRHAGRLRADARAALRLRPGGAIFSFLRGTISFFPK